MKSNSDLAIDRLLDEHVQLKRHLGELLNIGGIADQTPAEMGREDACELGKWIQGPGQAHLKLVAFSELKACHLRVHQCAAQVASLALYGDKASSKALFQVHFNAHLRRCGQSLRNLDATLKG